MANSCSISTNARSARTDPQLSMHWRAWNAYGSRFSEGKKRSAHVWPDIFNAARPLNHRTCMGNHEACGALGRRCGRRQGPPPRTSVARRTKQDGGLLRGRDRLRRRKLAVMPSEMEYLCDLACHCKDTLNTSVLPVVLSSLPDMY